MGEESTGSAEGVSAAHMAETKAARICRCAAFAFVAVYSLYHLLLLSLFRGAVDHMWVSRPWPTRVAGSGWLDLVVGVLLLAACAKELLFKNRDWTALIVSGAHAVMLGLLNFFLTVAAIMPFLSSFGSRPM